jgi:Photosynthesis system II assembly factor YCF48
MSAEDRDLRFERALAQHLRDGSMHVGCPDAETLAAYHERSLSLEEMAAWKQHIAGCAACQETLSLVEVTEKQLAADWEEQPIPVLAPAGREGETTGRAAKAGASETAAVHGASSAPVSITQKRRPALVRWAIPVGAVAAGVLVWIGIHEQSALRYEAPSKNVEVARNLPQPMPAAPSQYAVAPKATTPTERDKESSRLDTQLAENAPAPALVPKPKAQVEPRTDDFVAGDSLRKDATAAKKTPPVATTAAGAVVAGAAATPPPPPAPAPKEQAPAVATETVEVTSEAPTVNTKEKQPVDLPGGQSGANAVQDQKRVAALSNSKSAPQQYSDATTDAMMSKQGINGRNVSSLQMLVAPPIIRTPENKVWWKLGTGGAVELTTDAGKKWKTVDTGVTAQLTAGSAPSSKVCWIAGQVGTLVLSTDRGNHWTKLTTPIAGDLGGVHAVDAKHATIWDTANRLSYETSDGGATWKQTANE